MLLALTIIVCLGGAGATFWMLATATANYNPGSWPTVVLLGGWDAAVYVGIAAVAVIFHKSRRASIVVLCGAMAIAALSLSLLYWDLRAFLTPPTPGLRPMNCFGPLVQFGLPLLQWPALSVVAAIALICSRDCREHLPPV